MNKVKLNCPAKLNLNLSVVSKKINGMHEINTQFQLIDLFDEMIIEKTSSKYINVQTNIGPSIDGKKNIYIKLLKSYQIILEEIYCDISIKKYSFGWRPWRR